MGAIKRRLRAAFRENTVLGRLVVLPWRRLFRRRIPTVFITGTKGKTTVARMVSAILEKAGFVVGTKSTDGVTIGGQQLSDVSAGYVDAARVLGDRSITAAVLELGRGGLIRRGMYLDVCDAAALLNLGREQIGIDGVETLEEMAQVKKLVTDAARRRVVLNADDAECRKLIATYPPAITALFSLDRHSPTLAAHLARGGIAFCLDEEPVPRILRITEATETEIIRLADLPSAWGGVLRHNIGNAMAAAALADGIGVSEQAIRSGLQSFTLDPEQSLGRFNVITEFSFVLIIDRATSPPAAQALAPCLQGIATSGRRVCVMTSVGDRADWHYGEFIEAIHHGFDHFICYGNEIYRRGRALGEIQGRLKAELMRRGVDEAAIDIAEDYDDAIRILASRAKAGGLVAILGQLKAEDLATLRKGLAEFGVDPGGDTAPDASPSRSRD